MMNVTRRTLLGASASAALLPRAAFAAPTVLRSEEVQLQILPEGQSATTLWGFNGTSPGPELRARQGDTLAVRFENGTDQPSAIHWHGIRIENRMDGVPGLTQELVPPGGALDYAFRLPDAGTFWYHSHHQSWEQVAKGLYGPLIIEEREPPEVDADITVILDDWRLTDTGALADGFGNTHDFSHAGRLGNYAMVLPSQDKVRLGDRVRLRLINTATARVFPVRIEGLEAQVVAIDGMPVQAPRALTNIQLAPAQRVDVIGDVTAKLNFQFVARDALYDMGAIEIEGDKPDPATTPLPSLAPPDIAQPDLETTRQLPLKMEGGAMGGRHAGDDIWAFNGVSGLADAPFATFKQGETAVFDLINDTSFAHGIHLHGHHFYELTADGALGDLRDTSLVERGATQRIAVVFDNPGKWLLHCHMLGHQASGMKTWVEVA